MKQQSENRLAAFFSGWVDICQRRAGRVVILAVLVTGLAAVYLAENLRINTDTEDMLSAELSFRQDAIAVDQAFPTLEDNLLVVLEAPNADAANAGVVRLVNALAAQDDVFRSVYAPDADPFIRRHALMFLELGALQNLAAKLAAAQPFLGTLWRQPNLGGLADMTGLLAKAGDVDPKMLSEADAVLGAMAGVAANAKTGTPDVLVWSDVLFRRDAVGGPFRRMIAVQPVLDYGSLQPAARATEAIYATAQLLGLSMGGYQVRLTGSAALESDELKSVENGMGLAGLISMVLVTIVLLAGLRSVGAMVALLVTLVAGLVWTAALAMIFVGAFNLISVAFAVLFVGLSVDFGIHFTLRAREHVSHESGWRNALAVGAGRVGPSLGVCAVTTAIAFFSFLPTSYVGLAELGLIAGVGMGVALVANLTLLPALLRLLVRTPNPLPVVAGATFGYDVSQTLQRFALPIVVVGGVSALLAAWVAQGARFDFDPMNLRDRTAPSMRTLDDLAANGDVYPYAADVLVADLEAARNLSAQLEALPAVGAVHSVLSLIPSQQDEKLNIIDDMALYLGPAFFQPQGTIAMTPPETEAALTELRENLLKLKNQPGLAASAAALSNVFSDLGPGSEAAQRINQALFAGLPANLETLIDALAAGPVDVAALPAHLRSRYIGANGEVRLEVRPQIDTHDAKALAAFVADVQNLAPHASGAPVIIVEAGAAVLEAFAQALATSLMGIGIVLWLVLRRLRDVGLVFAPVFVAALWTLAVAAIFDVPFNFANVIVLPLLFGLSVDFGIHLVMRARDAEIADNGTVINPMRTSTPRAVLMSALTTIGSFGSIMLSGHPGTASMGQLLSIAISLSLLAVLVLLPAMLTLSARWQRGP